MYSIGLWGIGFFCWYWGFNSGPVLARQMLCPFSPSPSLTVLAVLLEYCII
jgi:hypothetical protein